jgi:hypothetical protein
LQIWDVVQDILPLLSILISLNYKGIPHHTNKKTIELVRRYSTPTIWLELSLVLC